MSGRLAGARVTGRVENVVILSGNHLCHNPRVMKEAEALSRAGFAVEVLGGWHDQALKQRDLRMLPDLPFRFTAVLDTTGPGLPRLGARLRSGLGSAAHRAVGLESRWQLGRSYSSLRRAAMKRPADLYIAHSEAGLAVVEELLRAGRRVGVDMEDWFSADLLPEMRRRRPLKLLRKLEARLLRQGVHASCPSHAMAGALAKDHCVPTPAVIYNAFPRADHAPGAGESRDRRSRNTVSIHWFSQSLGPGRGLEDLLAALPLLPRPVEVHLRAMRTGGSARWLNEQLPADLREMVFFHDLVDNAELPRRLREHDIGFSGDLPSIRNRDLTVTNKVLQYLQAGLAVVGSDTAGHREVAAAAEGAIVLYPSGDVGRLAAELNALLSNPGRLAGAKAAATRAAESVFSWERQEQVLLASVRRALRSGGSRGERH